MLGLIAVLFSVLLAILLVPRNWTTFTNETPPLTSLPLMDEDELTMYDGAEGSKGLYLAILGQVFDVDKGRKHYGPGGGYHCFTGKDGSLAFVTGDFSDSGLTDDISSLSPLQLVALYDWLAFYQKDYEPVGILVGRFYSENGQPTEALQHFEKLLAEGRKLKEQAQAENQHFPPCNSEWSASRGGRVWCSTKSGGVHRDWVGVPRLRFSPGSRQSRCVCVENPTTSENPNLQEYHGCPAEADSCPVGG